MYIDINSNALACVNFKMELSSCVACS